MKNKVVGIDKIENQVINLTASMAALRLKLEACQQNDVDLAVLKEFAEWIYQRRAHYDFGAHAEMLLRKGLHKEQ